MAKYQKYAEYKDSGVEWLGDLPSHWHTVSLKMLIDVRDGTHDTPSYVESNSNTYPLVTSKDVTGGRVDLVDCKHISEADYLNIIKRSEVAKGDILMPMIGTVGSPVLVEDNFEIAIKNLALFKTSISNEKLDSKFLLYFLNSSECEMQFSLEGKGGVQNFVSLGTLRNLILPLTKIYEQSQIANFLDHETAKIDSLIAKQEKLIELLKEKRQAVISHAVTKGLNPNVVMKDSGVEWLGQVPEHWQLVPLKYLCTFSGGGTPTKDNLSYWTDGNIPWVSPKDMKTFWISETQDYITEKAVKESSTNIVEQTSLLMVVRSGILQRTIPIAINTVPVTMNQDMKALKFGKRVLVEYIANLIHGNTAQLLLEWSKEGATVESIEHEYLANSLIPVPSLKEQEEITQVIAKKMKVYAELTEKAELQITLLQERRTALISSAVTGKINVSNWQHPNEAKTELSL